MLLNVYYTKYVKYHDETEALCIANTVKKKLQWFKYVNYIVGTKRGITFIFPFQFKVIGMIDVTHKPILILVDGRLDYIIEKVGLHLYVKQ